MSREQVHGKGGAVPNVDAAAVEHEQIVSAWHIVEEFAKSGRGSQKELPQHLAQLGDWTDEAKKKMPDIAKHASGDIVVECAAVLKMTVAETIELAESSKTKPTPDLLREYLRRKDAIALGTLNAKPALVKAVRDALRRPFGVELPDMAALPMELHDKHLFVKWFVETTNPTVAATVLAAGADDKLVSSLDAIAATTPSAWAWLDHLHIAGSSTVGDGVLTMRDKTTNAAARNKLEQLASRYQPDANQRDKEQTLSEPRFNKELGGHDDTAFLDAAARTQGSSLVERGQVPTRLAGKSADVVLEYLFTLTLYSADQIAEAIELLHRATGATRQHVLRLFSISSYEDVALALKKDVTRKHLRQMVGRDARIADLFGHHRLQRLHEIVIADEALRQWAYEDASPRNLLWVAAGSGKSAKMGCRLVLREHGSAWVKQLPADVDEAQLRCFVLNSPDVASVSWIKTHLLHDHAHRIDSEENEVHATDSYVYGQGAQLRPTALGVGADPQLVLARLADLNASERAAINVDANALKTVFAEVQGNELRAVELLAPTLGQLVKFPITARPDLVDYAVTRPVSEALAAARNADAAHKVFGRISPFVVMPALKEPHVLANALLDNDALVDWIFDETDASQALALLSREPARGVVAGLIESGRSAYQGLPAFENLRRAGRDGFEAITHSIKDADAKEQVKDYRHGDVDIDRDVDISAKNVKHATAAGNLVANLDDIIDNNGRPADVIAVVQAATAAQQIELLSGEHGRVVRKLQLHVQVGPQHVFPALSATQLLSLPSAAEWLLASATAPTTVLHLVAATPGAAKALAGVLDARPEIASAFSEGLPRGATMTALERFAIDEVAPHISNAATLRRLFRTRFDVEIETSYDEGETRQLWSVLRRLPPAQVNQNVIRGFTEGALGGPTGVWASPTIELEEDSKALAGDDAHYRRGIEMTGDEVKRYYGLDDKGLQLAADAKSGWLLAADGKYRVKEVNPTQFDATVIHEVGHSIDTLLGEHTDLIYDLAGWRQFGYDQFEEWASEMGAFDAVSGNERTQIADVWKQALRSHTAVSKLVGPDHPAVANKQSPLASFADEDKPFAHDAASLKPVHGKMFLQTPTTLATVKKQAWDAAPTNYSMTSPNEYFAECYVEYYRAYDGTPGTESQKGGRLPAWIKKWFDEHVDKIRFSPQRVKAGFGTP